MRNTEFALRIEAASRDDAGEVLTLQRAAFVTEAAIYGDPHLPPLTETLSELQAQIDVCLFLKATHQNRIVGAVRASINHSTAVIQRCAVAPDLQGRGIGTRLFMSVEELLRDSVDRFELFTGSRSEANLRLYRRLGYRRFRTVPYVHGITVIHLRKASGRAAQRLRPGQVTAGR